MNRAVSMRARRQGHLRVRGTSRPCLRLPESAARGLRAIRVSARAAGAPRGIGRVPALASVAAAAGIVGLCAWGFPAVITPPAVERSILVTVREACPSAALDTPAHGATAPDEPRPAAFAAEVPPPPAAGVALPASEPLAQPRVRPEGSALRAAALAALAAPAGPATIPERSAIALPDEDGDKGAFWQQVRRLVAEHTVYPAAAARLGRAGQVTIRVRVGTKGTLDRVLITTSSGDPALDRAAVTAVHNAAPFPVRTLGPTPGTNALEALIPVRFELVSRPLPAPPTPAGTPSG